MPSDEQDKAGVVAPPPLIYLGALVVGLLLNRRFPTTFLRWRDTDRPLQPEGRASGPRVAHGTYQRRCAVG